MPNSAMEKGLHSKERTPLPFKLLITVVTMLFVANVVVLGIVTGLIKLPAQTMPLETAKTAGKLLVDYGQRTARDLGVEQNRAVRDALAKFEFELGQSRNPEQVAQVMLRFGRETQDVILREQENLRREELLALIRQDPRLSNMIGEATITIRRSEENGLEMEDPVRLLSQETKEQIKESKSLALLGQVTEVKVVDGRASLVTPVSVLERLQHFEKEVDTLRARLQETKASAGLAPLNGSGIIIRLYDAEGSVSSGDIVHDYDVRDIVNELFAAGAAGIAIDHQRLIATSSIRCAGPVILVNQRPIAVNPVTIYALGDSAILNSSLDLIRAQFQVSKIGLEAEPATDITLPAYEEISIVGG
ncbi:MAG TPA: DUF881 domain-containing protein [bacterium]|jgi:uncharacterized protein YlxW (UPF0749 family)|nr:DUF881 domain-containing protein [bacterium]